MFLMKSSPLVALPRKWEPFAPSRSCRYPVCFSESEDDIARTTVSAKVQMIINNLQSDESSLGTGDEYGCIAQKKRKGAKDRDHKLRGNGRVLQERVAYGQRNCPADSDGMEVEESSEFGPLSLNSDSDDSVDRDIEEAIQEYLKNKGQSIQPLQSSAESLRSRDGGKRFQQEYPSHDAACNLFPASVKAEVVQQRLAPGYLGEEAVQWATSPVSVSSDDSFEQSIKAEIEQFLRKKKQQARKAHLAGKRVDLKEAPETLAFRSQKEGANCLSRSSLKRGGKALFPRQRPELQSGSAPPKLLQSGSPEELADFKTTSQAYFRTAVAGHSGVPEQSKEGKLRQKVWETRKNQNVEASDSSSDDGIEEAIQLYQLEKIKKEASSQTGRAAVQKDAFRAEGVADISASLTIRSVKSALPGTPRKVRGKQLPSQPAEPSRLGAAGGEPEKGRRCGPAANHLASGAVAAFQASCRADTAAELMCAEAILDISKTILPPPAGSDNKSLATGPFCSQSVLPSHQESDSNAVDSDDSIEQEIRAFLAIKAQTECLMAKSEANWRAVQTPPSSGQPGDQSRSPVCKTLQLSLSRKKKLKRESRVARQIGDKPETLSEVGCSPEDHSKLFAPQSQDAASILKAGETGEVAGCQWDALATVGSVDIANPSSQGLCRAEERAKTATRAPQKYGTGDKSSSLDSDEDLDTAIKDLLRSKRKLRKKSKDQRVQCKKKVRFGDIEMHVFEDKLSGTQERDCKPRAAPLLKSCLTRSRRDAGEDNTKSRPQTVVKGKPKSAKVVPFALECKKDCQPKPLSGPDNRDTGKTDQSPWTATSLTDDSSSVDSDDSIEQEIRKFLAEKAKDSTSVVKADRTVEAPGVAKPQTAPLRAKRPPLQAGGNALSKRRKQVKKAGPPTAESSNPLRCVRRSAGNSSCKGKQTVWKTWAANPQGRGQPIRAEDVGSQPPGKLQIVQAEGAALPVKRPAVHHQAVPDGELARRSLPAGKDKLPNDFKPISFFKRKSPCEFKISSKFITGLKNAQNKKTSVLMGKRPSLEGSVLKREGGRSAASVLSERHDAALQKGVLGSRSEAGVREAAVSTRCAAEGLRPCASERPGKAQAPLLSNKVLSFATVNPAGEPEPPSSAEASQGPPPQAPDTNNFRGAKVSTGPLRLEVPVEEERSQGHSTSWEERSVPNTPFSLPLKENALTCPDRLAEREAQEVLEGGSAEFTDGPVAEPAPCLVQSKSSSFLLNTSIDPGWRVLPYITLSPAELLASKTQTVQGRRRALQVLGENSRMKRSPEQWSLVLGGRRRLEKKEKSLISWHMCRP